MGMNERVVYVPPNRIRFSIQQETRASSTGYECMRIANEIGHADSMGIGQLVYVIDWWFRIEWNRATPDKSDRSRRASDDYVHRIDVRFADSIITSKHTEFCTFSSRRAKDRRFRKWFTVTNARYLSVLFAHDTNKHKVSRGGERKDGLRKASVKL